MGSGFLQEWEGAARQRTKGSLPWSDSTARLYFFYEQRGKGRFLKDLRNRVWESHENSLHILRRQSGTESALENTQPEGLRPSLAE